MVEGTISENNTPNLNWDGVWYVRTRIGEGGWTNVRAKIIYTFRF